MSDFVDNSDIIEEKLKARRIAAIRQQASAQNLLRIGKCHWCDEPVTSSQVFCDADCAHDHKRYKERKTFI